jgi:signal transduction histidine kinase
VIFFLILLFAFIQYRIRKLELDKQKLQRKVEEQTSEISRKNEELLAINSEKDKFFSIIAHDLRGPFSSLMMLTHEMAEGIQDLHKEEIGEILKVIKSSSENLFRLLENLLNWARIKQGKMPFSPMKIELSSFFTESLSLLILQAEVKKIDIAINISPGLSIYADRNMLQAVLRNLVSNAVKFTHSGGKIRVNAIEVDNQTMISVIDNGIGMNHDLLLKMFHIDEKSNRSGTDGEISTGLGLLLCKEFIEKHDGQIWVESEEDKGSSFHFSVPMQIR